MLQGKKILIGVSGSIAAYKTILLVRSLVKAGAEVRVVMTKSSKDFVSPLVLSTLSKNEVLVELENNNSWSNHVALGRWADVMLIAPLSCNTLAKMANGICDNLLLAVYLSATCPVCVAPAMDEDMWHHTATKNNIEKLKTYGNNIISVENGELASGLIGEGRMAEPESIIEYLIKTYFRRDSLKGKKAIVTAGPTYEAIDPVRFIGNHSSGKMGFAIAEALYLNGADVTLITGPTTCKKKFSDIKIINVTSSNQMYEAATGNFISCDIAILSAAVADYKPVNIATQKIKKSDNNWSLDLEKTKDILRSLGETKSASQYLMGFALETENGKENAIKKIKSKNLNAIVLNIFNNDNLVFGSDKNKITIIDNKLNELTFEPKNKIEVANDIVQFIISTL